MASREIPGSFRSEPAGAQAIRDADPDEKISVTVHLKTTEQPAGPTEARRAFARFATRHRLGVRHDPVRRRIQLDGTSEQLSRAFGTSLRIYDDGIRRFRARSGPLVVPEELETWTIAALGLDERPVVKHRRLTSAAAPADGDGLWPTQIADLYGLGHDLDAPGQCIGIIALGGGYLPADLAAAAKGMNRPLPMVVDCPVNGTTNLFGGGQPSDEEISLDLQVVAALVPSARIAVYFADNNLRGLTDAIRQAVADNVNRPRVLSISWGSAEEFWAQSDRDAVESAFTDAAKLGITVVAAAGDYLATAGLQDDQAHVLFPASSPLALACGGTQITLDSGGAALAGEAVWNDGSIGTGGGISDVFELPAYQKNAAIPPSFNDGKVRRGIPDICAAAAHTPGYRIVLNGQPQAMQGTSAAAPLWASLIAAANSRRGAPLGAVHSFLYADRTLCRAVVEGNNRLDGVGYDAGPGWNACTGLGVPNSRTVEGLAAIPDHQTQTVAAGNVSKTLDVAIGAVFLYLLLTFVASALLEVVARALNWRAKNLHEAIEAMLRGSKLLNATAVYRNPLVVALGRDSAAVSRLDVLERMGWRQSRTRIAPSYIPPATFSAVVLECLMNKSETKPAELSPDGAIKAVRDVVGQQSGNSDALLSVLRTTLATQGSSIQAVRLSIEKWFSDTMDRASGWYKRRTQTALLLFGLVVAFGGNVDTIAVVRWLWQSDTARQAVVAAATDYVKQNPAPTTDTQTAGSDPAKDPAKAVLERMATQISTVDRTIVDLQYPVGWPVRREQGEQWLVQWLPQYFLGSFITAIAISMGSTFWFDALQSLIKIRSTGPKPGSR